MSKHFSIAIFLFLAFVSFRCKQSQTVKSNATDSLVNMQSSPAGHEYEKGAKLIAGNDCLTCHRVQEKTTGPSFAEIATKYHHDQKLVAYLTNSVVHGSKGIYGEKEMTPHPQIEVQDIHEMIRYIFSVEKR